VLAAAQGRLRASVVTLTGDILSTADGELDPTASRATAVTATEEVLTRATADWGSAVDDLAAIVFGVAAPVPPAERGSGGRARPRPAAAAARRWEWIPTWLDGGFAAAVRDRVGVDTLVENDANLGALGELRSGAARDRSDVVHLKLRDRSIGCGLAETVDRYASPAMSEAATVRLGTLGATAETLGAVALLRHEWSRADAHPA
jgi:predicted NBD/HSP70 family sugar kinase